MQNKWWKVGVGGVLSELTLRNICRSETQSGISLLGSPYFILFQIVDLQRVGGVPPLQG